MMTFEQFTEEAARRIKKYLPEEYKDIDCEVDRRLHNNGVYMSGITFKSDRGNSIISPTIYMEHYFDIYNSTGSMDKVMEQIGSLAAEYLEADYGNFDRITDYEAVRGTLSPMLINTRENLGLLQELPHMRIEDLSLICRIGIRITNETGGINVTENFLKEWGIGKEQLFKQLSENMQKPGNYVLQEVGSVAGRLLGIDILCANLLEVPDDQLHRQEKLELPRQKEMYVLTNKENVHGAAALACPGVLEKISRIFPEGFYILPSSIHECMVVPKTDEINSRQLKALVRDINRTTVEKEEVLSDNVYEYDRERGKIRLAVGLSEKEKGMER